MENQLMKIRDFVALFVGIFGLCLLPGLAIAGEPDHTGLHAAHGWARETIPGTSNGAIYLTVHNPGSEDDRLIGVASDLAKRTEIHNSINSNGVMSMSRLAAVDIPAGEHVVFKPGGGPHIMLMGVTLPLKAGEIVKLNLTFELAGDFELEVPVVTMAEAMEKTGHDPSHNHSD